MLLALLSTLATTFIDFPPSALLQGLVSVYLTRTPNYASSGLLEVIDLVASGGARTGGAVFKTQELGLFTTLQPYTLNPTYGHPPAMG